jgi:hypothetical protein
MTTIKTPTSVFYLTLRCIQADGNGSPDFSKDYLIKDCNADLQEDPSKVYDFLADEDTASRWAKHIDEFQELIDRVDALDKKTANNYWKQCESIPLTVTRELYVRMRLSILNNLLG